MSEVKQNPHWMEGMIDVQKQYWDNISSMLQSFSTPLPTAKPVPPPAEQEQVDKHPRFHADIDSWPKLSQHCHHLASMLALYPKSAFHPEGPKLPSYSEAFAFGAFEHFSSIPAVGPSRESIEMLQQWQPLLSDFTEAWSAYQPILAEVGFKAWKLTLVKLAELLNGGQTLTTHQIYDLWIECGEQTHAEIVKTENYQKIYGKLTNTSMACKNHTQAIRQEMLRSMNLPTKQDLNSAYERIHALSREAREHKKDIADLQRQIKVLAASCSIKKTAVSKKSKEMKNAERKI